MDVKSLLGIYKLPYLKFKVENLRLKLLQR